MPNYMLLLHEQPSDFAGVSAAEMESIIGEYMAWRQKLVDEGKFVGSAKLRDEGGRIISGTKGDFRVTDGPYTEAKEVIGGYFTISAADYDEAVNIARECPHSKYGSRIEVREVEMMPTTE